MKKLLVYLIIIAQLVESGMFINLQAMDQQTKNVDSETKKIAQTLATLEDLIPACIYKYSSNGCYCVSFHKKQQDSILHEHYDELFTGATGDVLSFYKHQKQKMAYAFTVWRKNNYNRSYDFLCCFKSDQRSVKDVRFTILEEMVVVDFDDGSSINFYPDLITVDRDSCIDMDTSKNDCWLMEILPGDY